MKSSFVIRPSPDNIYIADGEDTVVVGSVGELATVLKQQERKMKLLAALRKGVVNGSF